MELLEAEISSLKQRRRGPKPLGVRARFAATAWLDGEILWRDGQVVWHHENRLVVADSRQLEAVSRALFSLQRHEKAARREQPDFDAWHRKTSGKWRLACQLAAIAAPDLETLVSPSRRRNPAALERLAQLLLVEALVAEPLPHSPARALFEAWPLSQEPLQKLLRDETQPFAARALATLILGAAEPIRALPGEPFLRRAARFGARFGFPNAPQLVVALLQDDTRDGEDFVARIDKTLAKSVGKSGPFRFDEADLMTLRCANLSAQTLAELAETAAVLTDPFPALNFAPVAPKRFDFEAQRTVLQVWNDVRAEFNASIRPLFLQIAGGGKSRDLELAAELMRHFIAAPVGGLGALKIDRHRTLTRRELSSPPLQTLMTEAAAVARDGLEAVANSPHSSALLELLSEVSAQNPFAATAENLSPSSLFSRWLEWASDEWRNRLTFLIRLTNRAGIAAAREALRLNCVRPLQRRENLSAEVIDFALEIVAWAPAGAAIVITRLSYLQRFWNGASGARAALRPVLKALSDAEPAARALWLSQILEAIAISRQGARCELPALARFVTTMRRTAPADNADFPHSELVECALALWKVGEETEVTPETLVALDARFDWLAEEMSRRFLAAEKEVDWNHLPELAGFLSRFSPDNEPQFRAAMAAGWNFVGWDGDFEWHTIGRGAKLARQFPAFQTVLGANFARCPARILSLLEKLGPLDRFEALRAPLETWRERNWLIPDASWAKILALEPDLQTLAARFATARREVTASETPPVSLVKIAAWPQKIEAEIAALRARGDLAPNLLKRLENLVARLENCDELRAAMREELGEALRHATGEAELRAVERAVENCYRVRLAFLGAPKNVALDANLLNAALFSTDVESNRKWLREIVGAHCENRVNWRLELVGNARWLEIMSRRGLISGEWLADAPQTFAIGSDRIELRLESSPLQILQMGNAFGTCLSWGGCNAFSSVANAVELNKRVVFARDGKNRVVGRQLLALSSEGKLLGFRVYTSLDEKQSIPLRAAFGDYARNFAARCGLELADHGQVERLFVSDWYDDGSVPWNILNPVGKGRKTIEKEVKMKQKNNKSTVLTGRDAWIARLQAGETVSFREGGNSMTPRIKSRQKCTYVPVQSLADISVGDAVFCRVGSSYFTHLVTAIKGEQVQIGNNHGHINGWTNLAHIYGKVVKIEN